MMVSASFQLLATCGQFKDKFTSLKKIYILLTQNRSNSVRLHRAGGSLSLSEQEYDSDELDIPLSLKSTPKSRTLNDPMVNEKLTPAEI